MASEHQIKSRVWWFYTRADRQKLKEQDEGQDRREEERGHQDDQKQTSGAEQR